MQFAASRHHRASVGPSRRRTVQIDDLCSCRGISIAIGIIELTWTSAHDQHLANIVHYCRSPVTLPIIAVPHWVPSTSASDVEVPCGLTRPRREHLAVRRNKHEWIERQRQV